MNKKLFFICLLLLTALLAGCAKEKASNEETTEISTVTTTTVQQQKDDRLSSLQVKGTTLMNEDGNPVQLRGISTHGLSWFPAYVNKDCFKHLKEEWKINAVRLAMYTAENGGYCTDGDKDKLKALIKKGVDYATDCGLYVIIDWHILSDGNPNTYIEESKAFFEEMSKEYANHTNVIYEICNEPNGGTTWEQVKSYAEAIIPIIRKNSPDALILVGTPNWCQYVDKAAESPISGYDNIMYTLHFYAATHRDDLRSAMTKAIESGLPVFVSEFGICDASGNGTIDTVEADKWVSLMNKHNVSYMAWNLSNKDESSALIDSTCTKTSDFTQDDLSESGKWLYSTLGGSPASTASASSTVSTTATSAVTVDNNVDIRTKLSKSAISLTMIDSWEENGKTCKQYSLSIKNNSEKAYEGWDVSLDFGSPVTLVNNWNGKFKTEATTLTISHMDYNRTVSPKSTINDIGFIIKI